MKIQILVDNRNSWYIPYANILQQRLNKYGFCRLIHNHNEVEKGDILCLLACEKIFKRLELNTHNIVVHESDLPKGKGWSPVSWSILSGNNNIHVCLFEATLGVDAGVIYYKDLLEFNGTELLNEIKNKQGIVTNQLVEKFVQNYPNNIGVEQEGEETFYPRRNPEDSGLDINKSLKDQFNLLRVVDNDRYPAFFEYKGERYYIKIFKDEAQ